MAELQLLGIVEAGFPTSAEEELMDTLTLDEWVIGNKEASYLLKVKSKSMEDAGIFPGDTLVVERGKDARKNDIVIVEKEGSYSMQYFSKLKKEARVEAVVTAVIRKYR
jgi:SOS-response transcriptional repressor LexA